MSDSIVPDVLFAALLVASFAVIFFEGCLG